MTALAIQRAMSRTLGDLISGRSIAPSGNPRVGSAGGEIVNNGYGMRLYRAPENRVRELKFYDYLETEIADVRKALDAFATMAVTGSLAGGNTNTFTIRMNQDVDFPAPLLARLARIEKVMQRHSFQTTRMMVKYGSYIPCLSFRRDDKGTRYVNGLKPIPPGTMFRNLDAKGESDPQAYWTQRLDGTSPNAGAGGASKTYPIWLLPHFAMWSSVVNAMETLIYGTSILQPFGAIGLKTHAVVDALVVARLSRAAMRYKYKIDVSDILKDPKAIQLRVNQYKMLMGREESLLSGATTSDTFQRARVPDNDFFMPAGRDLSYDVDTIEGDLNLSRVTDVELLFRIYFGALGVPPEYLGHERSQGGRSNLSQVDINFARSSRHVQMFSAAAWEHVVMVDMILGGWDPRDYPIECVPPRIGARDDLLQSQIRALQAAVISALKAAGMDLSVAPQWVLTTFMHLDEELKSLDPAQIDRLFVSMEEMLERAASGGDDPRGGVSQRGQDMLASTLNLLRVVGDNVRLLTTGRDSIVGDLHRYGQPDVDDLYGVVR